MFGVDFATVRAQFVAVELGQIEEMAGFELVVPGSADSGLVQQEGLLTLLVALIIVNLKLPEERCQDFDVVLWPSSGGEPSGKMAVAVHELFPGKLFVGQRVRVGSVGGSCAEGQAVVTGFCDVPEVFVDRFFSARCSAALDGEIPERDVFELAELLYGVRGRLLHGQGMTFGLEVNGRQEGRSLICSLEREALLILELQGW
jgi:hypothetical protein